MAVKLTNKFYFSNFSFSSFLCKRWPVGEVRHLHHVNINASKAGKKEAGPHMWVSDAERQPVVGDISPLFVGIWCRHTCRSPASDMCERVCASLYGVRLGGGGEFVDRRVRGGGATTCISNYLFCLIPFFNISFTAFAFFFLFLNSLGCAPWSGFQSVQHTFQQLPWSLKILIYWNSLKQTNETCVAIS